MMKKFFSILITAVTVLYLVPSVQAFSKTTYPISSLGNCRDAKECFYYCEIPKNHISCSAYAASHLFKKVLGETTTSPEPHPYSFPIAELGNCASPQDCSAFCNKEENHPACATFFQKKATGVVRPVPEISTAMQKVLNDAKTILGCISLDACRDFCNQPENKQKCLEFSHTEGAIKQNEQSDTANRLPQMPDCTKPENNTKCMSYGLLCGNFCEHNPGHCRSTPLTSSPSPLLNGKRNPSESTRR